MTPEARRLAVPGCRLCIECRREEEQRQKFKR
ncbi:TraR/DksA C4-type zinc finger protein [Neisseria meningitidis]|nr:TraR/DksA C4-type zinc finger protein [Neisseria meningitidis]